MYKVYLLLRNNEQTGPHSLEELVQHRLKPNDLIWVEGKSTGWSYPSEIDTLQPYIAGVTNTSAKKPDDTSGAAQQTRHQAYLPANENASSTNKTNTKKVFVSLPNKPVAPLASAAEVSPVISIEQKAEELRRRAQAYAAAKKETPVKDTIKTHTFRSLNEAEEDDIFRTYTQKAKKKTSFSKRGTAIVAVAALLLIVGYIIATDAFNTEESTTKEFAVQQSVKEEASSLPDTPEAVQQATAPVENATATNEVTTQKATNTIRSASAINKGTHTAGPQEVNNTESTSNSKRDNETSGQQVSNNNDGTIATKSKDEEMAAPEKKKTLGEKIDGFFDKFKHKKTEEAPAEEPRSTAQMPGTAERKAAHRGEDRSSPADNTATANNDEAANLADFVDITANEGNNWMMGIQGLKITLHNRSNETIRTASVEVRYYNEDKELLEKKIINFTNVPPKKSVTLPAPDHRLADHTDYRLLSASN